MLFRSQAIVKDISELVLESLVKDDSHEKIATGIKMDANAVVG